MPESHQVIVARAFRNLWDQLYNRASPDVELGLIDRAMTQILLTLGTAEGAPEEQWVLTQLMLGPRTLGMLQSSWAEHQLAQVPAPEDRAEFERYFANEGNRVRVASAAIKQAVDPLLQSGRIQWDTTRSNLRLP